MPNLKNYGTVDNPIWMTDPPQTADGTTTTPYNRYDQAHVSEANMIKDLQDTLSDGTVGNTVFFGTGVTGTEGDISYTVAGSKANDQYLNTSSFNLYKAKAANVWNYIGNLKGTPGTNGTNGVGVANATVNGSGRLILTLTDTSTIDAGEVKGAPGTDGAGSGWTLSTDSSSGSRSVTLANGSYFILTSASVSALTITNGFSAVGDTATIEFTSPSTAATYSAPTGAKHYGDDCASGDFTPAANTTYKIVYEKWNAGLTAYVKARS